MRTIGYAAQHAGGELTPFHFDRRGLRDNDVAIEILYCGICHSDLHQVNNDWGFSEYPMVPGHEIIGRVTDTGADVTRYQPGDHVAVGCMVDSCMECDQCQAGDEQFCRNGMTQTYNSADRITGDITYGGYSKHIVVRDDFVLSVPDALDLSRAAPILCAGITTYSPLRDHDIGDGDRVGVIGLGGLGHMAVKLASAMGGGVTVITRSPDKSDTAMDIGADQVVISTDGQDMEAAANSLDLIISTVPVKHDVTPYLPLLDVRGELVLVGQIGPVDEMNTMPMVFGNRGVSASLIGGITATQEVLDFCADHNIHPDCEHIPMEKINDAFDRLENGDVAGRIVIDMDSLSVEG